jgi:hypothetical protein
LIVHPATVARPDTTVGVDAALRQRGQTGVGGWTSWPQSVHPWTRSCPSPPDVQNHPVVGESSGNGRVGDMTLTLDSRRRGFGHLTAHGAAE